MTDDVEMPGSVLGHWRSGMTVQLRSLGLMAVLMFSGCAPVHTVERYGVLGTVVDASSGMPIRESSVSVTIDDEVFERTTNHNGEVRVAPDHDWHWSWLGGPAHLSRPGATIEIGCDGHHSEQIKWSRYVSSPVTDRKGLTEDGGVLDIGRVMLQKH